MTSAGALEAHADVANSKKTLRYRGRLEMSCDKAIFPDRKTCHMCIMIYAREELAPEVVGGALILANGCRTRIGLCESLYV